MPNTSVHDRDLIAKYTNRVNQNARNRRQWIGQEIGTIPIDDLFQKMELQEWACIYCGDKISYSTCELDHVEPLAKGGAHYLYNVFFACRICNSLKKDKSLKRLCSKLNIDIDDLRQKMAEINQQLHESIIEPLENNEKRDYDLDSL